MPLITASPPDVGTAMTRKDTAMNWDQIETKWALMTRRIRADFGDERIDAPVSTVRTFKRRDALTSPHPDSRTPAFMDTELKISGK
jgi:hypothetical protein